MHASPLVSFIILTYNSETYLTQCISSVLGQDYYPFEVLVIDAGSTDGTNRIIGSFQNSAGNMSVFTYPGSSIGVARQKGTEHSNGEYCAFIDSDCVLPSNDWLSEMMKGFTGPDIAGTWTLGAFHKNDPSIMKYSILSNPLRGQIPGLVGRDNFKPIGTGHTVIRKREILVAGGFRDLPAAEDIDLIWRIAENGALFRYIAGVEVYHYHVTSFSQLIKKTGRNIGGGMKSAAWQNTFLGRQNILRNSIAGAWNISVIGPFLFSISRAVRDREWAWLWHPFVSFCNAITVARMVVFARTP
jgi:glycosyltransferase involved in cell wall biosynthesis